MIKVKVSSCTIYGMAGVDLNLDELMGLNMQILKKLSTFITCI